MLVDVSGRERAPYETVRPPGHLFVSWQPTEEREYRAPRSATSLAAKAIMLRSAMLNDSEGNDTVTVLPIVSHCAKASPGAHKSHGSRIQAKPNAAVISGGIHVIPTQKDWQLISLSVGSLLSPCMDLFILLPLTEHRLHSVAPDSTSAIESLPISETVRHSATSLSHARASRWSRAGRERQLYGSSTVPAAALLTLRSWVLEDAYTLIVISCGILILARMPHVRYATIRAPDRRAIATRSAIATEETTGCRRQLSGYWSAERWRRA